MDNLLPDFNHFFVVPVIALLTTITSVFPVPLDKSTVVSPLAQSVTTHSHVTPTTKTTSTSNKDLSAFAVDKAGTQPVNKHHLTPNDKLFSTQPTETTTPETTTDTTSQSSTPTITTTPTKMETATTTITRSGKTIHLTMQYPSTGGPITGKIDGDCSGTLGGTYDGPSTEKLHGSAKATCPMGFIQVPVDITYAGKLTAADQANIAYQTTALGQTESGTTVLHLSE